MECIVNLGPEGELCLIQGITEDGNQIVRANCAAGLASIGASTLRTLLISLFDQSELVRDTIQAEISKKISFEAFVQEFEGKSGHQLTLRISLQDILEKQIKLRDSVVRLFNEILHYIAENKEESNI